MTHFACICSIVVAATAWAPSCLAIQIKAGDIIAPQFIGEAVLVVDSTTGNRDTLSNYPSVGSGPRISFTTSIARLPSGEFLVAEDIIVQGISSIDPLTGNRTFMSGTGPNSNGYPASRGSGPIDHANSVLVTSDGQVILVNQGGTTFPTGFVTRIDLATGNRTLISGMGAGSGFSFGTLGAGDLSSSDHLIVASSDSIVDVDLMNGLRTLVSGPGRGAGFV